MWNLKNQGENTSKNEIILSTKPYYVKYAKWEPTIY